MLVLSPSLGTTATLWESQLAAFTGRFHVLRHDHPGHGASPPPDGPVRVEGIARALLDLLDELGVERASFCGVSLGGMVGMWLGANAPERLEHLALCSTGAKLGAREDYRARAELVRREGTGVVVDGARERWFSRAFRDTPEASRILDELRASPAKGYAACCEAVGEWDFRGELHRIAVPTLAVFGEEDPVTTTEVRDTLLAGIPGVRSAEIAGASHLANVEQPEAFATAVSNHLQEGTTP